MEDKSPLLEPEKPKAERPLLPKLDKAIYAIECQLEVLSQLIEYTPQIEYSTWSEEFTKVHSRAMDIIYCAQAMIGEELDDFKPAVTLSRRKKTDNE